MTIVFARIIIDFAFVLLAYRMGKEWLFALRFIVNLILISTFGEVWCLYLGFTTNAGNGFYAAVFWLFIF